MDREAALAALAVAGNVITVVILLLGAGIKVRPLRVTREGGAAAPVAKRPSVQAVFCIDVRSEVIRRSLEGVAPGIETLGFAGFFGLAVTHRRFASDVAEHRLPVLLKPSVSARAAVPVVSAG